MTSAKFREQSWTFLKCATAVLFGAGCMQGQVSTSAALHEVPGSLGSPPPSASSARAGLGYRPSSARRLELIQKSPLALEATELQLLEQNGFVVSSRLKAATFAKAYAEIYSADLPVYVSADSILEAVHSSYDALLSELERTALSGEVCRLLGSMRERLGEGIAKPFGASTLSGVDEYLAVGAALCLDRPPQLVLKADASNANRMLALAKSAAGPVKESLFGVTRTLDYSLFRPRGHYEKSPELQRYFRTLMWLGIELSFAERNEGGALQLNRRTLDSVLALRALLDAPALQRWASIDRILGLFMGRRDSLAVSELDGLIRGLGVNDALRARDKSDAEWSSAIDAAGISTQPKARETQPKKARLKDLAPLPVFALFGQRTTPDSAIFSELTYDRLAIDGKPKRMMPNPLDVGYAAFGNAAAKALLAPELERYGYAHELERVRAETTTLLDESRNASLYSLWLGSLRTLSANKRAGLPTVANSDAWGRRILNTQLGSWAELRHNTILYAKQSATSSISCKYPDAYVDPYPEFYAALERYAELGSASAEFARYGFAGEVATRSKSYFDHLKSVAGILKNMAIRERRGEPFTDAQMKFINEAVVVDTSQVGCGGGFPHLLGWYARLFYDSDASLRFEPTIADVHTQPTDEKGATVGRVLHVGTGAPRMMVVTVDTCDGPAAYVGPVFAYYEHTTDQFVRLTDSAWKQMLSSARSPEWMTAIMPGTQGN